jgi:hypothetical protein
MAERWRKALTADHDAFALGTGLGAIGQGKIEGKAHMSHHAQRGLGEKTGSRLGQIAHSKGRIAV